MKNAVKEISDVTDDDEWESSPNNEAFAILGVVQPTQETMPRREPVLTGELLHFLLGRLLRCCASPVKIGTPIVNVGLLVSFGPAMNIVGDRAIEN